MDYYLDISEVLDGNDRQNPDKERVIAYVQAMLDGEERAGYFGGCRKLVILPPNLVDMLSTLKGGDITMANNYLASELAPARTELERQISIADSPAEYPDDSIYFRNSKRVTDLGGEISTIAHCLGLSLPVSCKLLEDEIARSKNYRDNTLRGKAKIKVTQLNRDCLRFRNFMLDLDPSQAIYIPSSVDNAVNVGRLAKMLNPGLEPDPREDDIKRMNEEPRVIYNRTPRVNNSGRPEVNHVIAFMKGIIDQEKGKSRFEQNANLIQSIQEIIDLLGIGDIRMANIYFIAQMGDKKRILESLRDEVEGPAAVKYDDSYKNYQAKIVNCETEEGLINSSMLDLPLARLLLGRKIREYRYDRDRLTKRGRAKYRSNIVGLELRELQNIFSYLSHS